MRIARDTVRDAAPALDTDTLDRLLLCTSEVVTNAIEHGAPPIELKVSNSGPTIRVEVSDGSTSEPRQAQPAAMSIRGRGLLIVDRCASRWGVRSARRGKTVWFEVD